MWIKSILGLASVILVLLISDRGAQAAGQCRPLYGMTITHFSVDVDAVCRNGRDGAFMLAKGAIIPQYDDPAVRGKVKKILAQTFDAGYGMVRTVLWFTQDRIMAPWGQLHAPLQPDDAKRIKAYGEDIRAAGFKKWLVVFVPGIRSSPACRLVTWGDCYDAGREATSLRFIQDVHALLAPLDDQTFRLEYDLSGELCPSRYLPAPVRQNITNYITHLITWYSHAVSARDFHISCGGLSNDREALLLDIFDSAGVKPNMIDMHLYDEDRAMIARKLLPAAEEAKRRGIPIIIGEMQYESDAESAGIAAVAHDQNICFSELIEWPLRGSTICQFNVNPPFSPNILRSEMESDVR